MPCRERFASLLPCLLFSAVLGFVAPLGTAQDAPPHKAKKIDASNLHSDEPAMLWQDPGRIADKDLYLGLGGKKHEPKSPFQFLKEDSNGTNPKFDVRDADGKKWRVKLGTEARPEVVASRLMWAVGFYANEDYLLPSATVREIQMKRRPDLIQGDQVRDARFERKPGEQKSIGYWQWKNNPFKDSKEFNGLRVMMAVMNNWDLKDVNNAIYQDEKNHQRLFLVSDLGATFASNNEHATHDTDKGNLDSYEHSKFIVKKTDKDISFGTPSLPKSLLVVRGPVLFPEAIRRSGVDWIGHDIPLADARWMGSLLAQLSHQQLEDAFRAGNFPEAEREQFVKIVEGRIAELKAL